MLVSKTSGEGSIPSAPAGNMPPSSSWSRTPGSHPGNQGFESPWRYIVLLWTLFVGSFRMLFVKEKTSLDNRVGRFAVTLFLAVAIYFLFGIFEDVSMFLGR